MKRGMMRDDMGRKRKVKRERRERVSMMWPNARQRGKMQVTSEDRAKRKGKGKGCDGKGPEDKIYTGYRMVGKEAAGDRREVNQKPPKGAQDEQ